MNPSSLLFLVVLSAVLLSVGGSAIPKAAREEDPDEPHYDPRFTAVFIQTDDGNGANTFNKTTPHGYEKVYNKANKVEDVLDRLALSEKVEAIIHKLGGDSTEEASRFKNIIHRLENSTFSKNAIETVKRILTHMDDGEGFAILGA